MIITEQFDRKKALYFSHRMYVDSVRQMCWIMSDEAVDYGFVIEAYWHTLMFLANKKVPKRRSITIDIKNSI